MKSKSENPKTNIAFDMDAHTNKLLSEASSKSQRTKRGEAYLRLADHLERFISISHKGEAIARDKDTKEKELSAQGGHRV